MTEKNENIKKWTSPSIDLQRRPTHGTAPLTDAERRKKKKINRRNTDRSARRLRARAPFTEKGDQCHEPSQRLPWGRLANWWVGGKILGSR